MKRICVHIIALTAVLLLTCITALAASDNVVKNLRVIDSAATTVVPMQQDGKTNASIKDDAYTEASIFQVRHSVSVQDNNLYLAMFLQGNEGEIPTESKIYYLEVTKSQNGVVSFNAYPISLTPGSYRIKLTDYANGGALNDIATFDVSNDTSDSAIILGDVNGDNGLIDGQDAAMIIDYFMKGIPLTEEQLKAANVNHDDKVDGQDVAMIVDWFMKGIPLE